MVLFEPPAAIRSGTAATIQYWLKHPAQNVRVDILDARGQLVRTYPDTANAGGGRGVAGVRPLRRRAPGAVPAGAPVPHRRRGRRAQPPVVAAVVVAADSAPSRWRRRPD